jgi:hypothetical protein
LPHSPAARRDRSLDAFLMRSAPALTPTEWLRA